MRKMILLAALAAIAALMLAATPAFAADGDGMGQDKVTICHVPPGNPGNAHTITVGASAAAAHLANHPGDFLGACNKQEENNNNNNRFCDHFDCNNFFVVPEITQTNEQEVESGNATQNINVSGGGANSNQCVGVQGITNTGNATNNTGVIQTGTPFFNGNNNDRFFRDRFDRRFFDDGFFFNPFFNGDGFNNGGNVEVNDVGNLTISPSQSVSCNQQVNQAATASG